MPMFYRIDKEAGAIFMVARGVLTDDEMVSCVARLREDPDLLPGMPTLSDMRGVKRLEITKEGLRRMIVISKHTQSRRGVAKAAIVTADQSAFGMARMLSSIGEIENAQPAFKAFRDEESARAWLGLP